MNRRALFRTALAAIGWLKNPRIFKARTPGRRTALLENERIFLTGLHEAVLMPYQGLNLDEFLRPTWLVDCSDGSSGYFPTAAQAIEFIGRKRAEPGCRWVDVKYGGKPYPVHKLLEALKQGFPPEEPPAREFTGSQVHPALSEEQRFCGSHEENPPRSPGSQSGASDGIDGKLPPTENAVSAADKRRGMT